MIRDNRTTFANPIALNTGAPADYVIGDVVDLGVTGRDIGSGSESLWFVVIVSTTATGAGASGQFHLGTSDAAALTAPTKVVSSTVIPVASLTAGSVAFLVQLPPAIYKRYIGLVQTTSGAAFTAGAVRSFLVEDVNILRLYAQGFTG